MTAAPSAVAVAAPADSYESFLASKAIVARPSGRDIEPERLHPMRAKGQPTKRAQERREKGSVGR